MLGLLAVRAGRGDAVRRRRDDPQPERHRTGLLATGICVGTPPALFCLMQLVRQTFRGWWRYLVKPLVLLICLQTIGSAAIIMGNSRNLHDDDIIAGTFFITFPAVLLIVTLCVPSRWFSRRATAAGVWRAGGGNT